METTPDDLEQGPQEPDGDPGETRPDDVETEPEEPGRGRDEDHEDR